MWCSRVQNLLSAYLDRELPGAEMLAIQRHVGRCPACAAEQEALRRTKSLLGSLAPSEPPGPFSLSQAESRAARRAATRRSASPAARFAPLVRAGCRELTHTLSGGVRRLRWDVAATVSAAALSLALLAAASFSPMSGSASARAAIPASAGIDSEVPTGELPRVPRLPVGELRLANLSDMDGEGRIYRRGGWGLRPGYDSFGVSPTSYNGRW